MDARRRDVVLRRAAIADDGEGGCRPKDRVCYGIINSEDLVVFDNGRDV